MANQPEQVQYDAGVYQLEAVDPVDGGVGAVSNKPLLNLANRTAYLKQHIDNLESGATIPPTMAPLNSPAFTGTPTVPTPALGDNSQKVANTAFVQNTVNGVLIKSVAGGVNVTLTAVEAGNGILVFTGLLAADISVLVPATSKSWIVSNQTTGAFKLTVKTAAGTGVAVAQGRNAELYCDGTNVAPSSNDYTSIALAGTPTTPTPASGDASQTVVNAAFVFNATDGMAGINVAGNSDVTLTQAQAGSALLNLSGALTANINLVFPQQTGQWVVANNSSGAFAITAKTSAAGGASIALPQGSAVIVYSDGTNMALASSVGNSASFVRTPFAPAAGTTALTVPTGYTPGNIMIERNGALLESADFTATNGSTITLTKATVAGDVINVYAFKTFTVANAVMRSGDAMAGPLSVLSATDPAHALPLGQANQIFGGSVTTVSAGVTALTSANAGLVLVNASAGNVTINLPAANAQFGLSFQFIRIDNSPGNTVTVNRTGTDTIDGSVLTSFQLVGQYDRRFVKSNGISAWYVVSASFASNAVVYQSAAQASIAAGTFTKVALQTKFSDPGLEFDAATNYRFTAKQAGLYQINGGINVNAPAANTGYFCAIYQNGSMVARGSSVLGYTGAVQACAVVSGALFLNAGDTIELYAYGDAGFSLVSGPSATRLSIARIQ